MNFSELKTELAARGFDYLSDTRLGRYINWARAELDDTDLWPYREATSTGAAPLTIADLAVIGSVSVPASDRTLEPADPRDLLAAYGDLANTGTARFYYVTTATTVSVYPVDTLTLSVRYWKVTADLTGTDTPAAPARFHKVIVDIATREAYRDADNHQAAEALQVQIDRDLWRMREALLVQQTQGPQSSIQITESW